jgi:hypothetical protein
LNKMKNTLILSISSKNLDCMEIAKKMNELGINCDITSNISISNGNIENGCRITTTVAKDKTIDKIWKISKSCGNINCGHISVTGIYNGCTNDYPWVSKCPGNK